MAVRVLSRSIIRANRIMPSSACSGEIMLKLARI